MPYGRMKTNKLDRDQQNRVGVEFITERNNEQFGDKIKENGGAIASTSKTQMRTVLKVYLPEDKIYDVKDYWIKNCLS